MNLGELETLSYIVTALKRISLQLNNFYDNSSNFDNLTKEEQKKVNQLTKRAAKLVKGLNETCPCYIIPFWRINKELSELLLLKETPDWPENSEILKKSQKDWAEDLEMQSCQYKLQLNAFNIIQEIKNSDHYNAIAMNKAKNEWPKDYEMQLYYYKNIK